MSRRQCATLNLDVDVIPADGCARTRRHPAFGRAATIPIVPTSSAHGAAQIPRRANRSCFPRTLTWSRAVHGRTFRTIRAGARGWKTVRARLERHERRTRRDHDGGQMSARAGRALERQRDCRKRGGRRERRREWHARRASAGAQCRRLYRARTERHDGFARGTKAGAFGRFASRVRRALPFGSDNIISPFTAWRGSSSRWKNGKRFAIVSRRRTRSLSKRPGCPVLVTKIKAGEFEPGAGDAVPESAMMEIWVEEYPGTTKQNIMTRLIGYLEKAGA